MAEQDGSRAEGELWLSGKDASRVEFHQVCGKRHAGKCFGTGLRSVNGLDRAVDVDVEVVLVPNRTEK